MDARTVWMVLALLGCDGDFPAAPSPAPDSAPVDAMTLGALPGGGDMGEDGDRFDATLIADAEAVVPPPVAGELVINEVDYDQAEEDAYEFVELLNVADGPRDLDGVVLKLLDAGGEPYLMRILEPGILEPGGRAVLTGARRPDQLPPEVILRPALGPEPNRIRNREAAIELQGPKGAVLDLLGYEGGVAEGSPSAAADDGEPPSGSVGRCPDGADSDDNATDLARNPESTPGLPNRCP